MVKEIIISTELISKEKWLKIRQEAFRLFCQEGEKDKNWDEAFKKVLGNPNEGDRENHN